MKRAFVLILLVVVVPSIQPAEPPVAALRIDSSYATIWKEKGIVSTQRSSDEEFLRRISLDLTGRIPTLDQSLVFLESKDPGKREKLIRQLLDSAEYGEYFAALWTNLILGHEKERFVDREAFQDWFEERIASDTGWDRIVSLLISAEGSFQDTPQLNWFARQKLNPNNLADDTARLFLGIQLGCARCHNHPHDQWKLEDFYGLAAFYSGMKPERFDPIEKMKARELKSQKELEEFRRTLPLKQDSDPNVFAEVQGGRKTYPAKFLLTPQPAHLSGESKRKALAKWVTAPDNPFFAKALVNRVWGMMMGKGFVEPVDDMGSLSDNSNPELLAFLTEDFKQHGYSLRLLLWAIANSKTYQLSSRGGTEGIYYQCGKVEMLNADQTLNSFLVITNVDEKLRSRNRGDYEEKRDLIYRHHVFLFDNDDNRGKETEFRGTISQALFLLNGKMTNEAIRPLSDGATSIVLRRYPDTELRLDGLFLTAVSRRPFPAEKKVMLKYVEQRGDAAAAYEDILWALLNSNEFLFNH